MGMAKGYPSEPFPGTCTLVLLFMEKMIPDPVAPPFSTSEVFSSSNDIWSGLRFDPRVISLDPGRNGAVNPDSKPNTAELGGGPKVNGPAKAKLLRTTPKKNCSC
jgi:hypothetical protein